MFGEAVQLMLKIPVVCNYERNFYELHINISVNIVFLWTLLLTELGKQSSTPYISYKPTPSIQQKLHAEEIYDQWMVVMSDDPVLFI